MRILVAVVIALLSTTSYAQTCANLVAPPSTTLSFTGPGYWRYIISEGFLAGEPTIDELDAEFYSSSFGSFNLATGANDNYSTCDQCITFSRDYTDPVNNKLFFQSTGTITITQAPGPATLNVQLSNTRLVEVTLDPNTYVSTPVPGGECYDLVPNEVFLSGFDD
ncbi:hypothetical protein [Dokdonella sp.]|uniref:hypothetical protein n=1 Tax=Dokdonella sp. TaxID=2291710 RepID=UPI003C3D6AF8